MTYEAPHECLWWCSLWRFGFITDCLESGGWTAHLSTKLSSMMIVFLSVGLALLDGNDGRCSDVLGAC